MIEIACPQCQKRYRLDDRYAGKKAKCAGCGQIMSINAPPSASPAVPSATAASPVPTSQPVPVATPRPALASPPAPATRPAPASIPVAELVPPAPVATRSVASRQSPAMPANNKTTGHGGETTQTLRGTTSQLQYEISQRPDFSILKIQMPQGAKVFAEPSAMVSMTPSMHLEAGFKGGLGKTFGRLLGGESLIINTFTAQDGPGEVMFAGGAAGDVAYHRLNGNTLYLQRGAYMLNSEGVEVSGKWQGAKGFFSGEGLVLLKATGTGDIFFNSYGAIIPIDVTEGFMVDTGYIVAFEESLQYRVTVLPGLRTAGKIKSFFFGGEGLVCQFAGSGRVWIQTRQVKSFLSWVNAFRPTKSN